MSESAILDDRALNYRVPAEADVAGLDGAPIPRSHHRRPAAGAADRPDDDLLAREVGDGFAAFEGEPGEHLLNPLGGVHGGWALTLIDSAGGCAAHSTLPAGVGYATIETKGNFSRPITRDTGPVRAEGRVVARGAKSFRRRSRCWPATARCSRMAPRR